MKNLNVNPQGLRDHSRAVDDVVGGVSSARKASGATLSSGAFGIMCQFFVPPLTIVKIVADAAIEAVGESLEEMAAGGYWLTRARSSYRRQGDHGCLCEGGSGRG